jgi:hypothetical protein
VLPPSIGPPTELQLLFIVVLVLFGVMNVGAALGLVLGWWQRGRVLARLKSPECGFSCAAGGGEGGEPTWLWHFALDPLTEELSAPSGSALRLCIILGMPVARLRAALPDEWHNLPDDRGAGDAGGGTAMGPALGRKRMFSRAGMERALAMQALLLRIHDERVHEQPTTTMSGDDFVDDVDDVGSAAAAPVTEDTTSLQHFVGTALVLAFLQVTQLLPVVELSAHSARAARHFAGIATPAGWNFTDTRTKFLTLLSPGVLSARQNWWATACVWRLILSQTRDGAWPCSGSVAFAIHARALREVAELQPSCFSRIKDKLTAAAEVGAKLADGAGVASILEELAGGNSHEGANGVDDAHGSGGKNASKAATAAEEVAAKRRRSSLQSLHSARLLGAQHEDGSALDDPLSCSARSIAQAMPRRLLALTARVEGNGGGAAAADDSALLLRVWSTLCCIAALERSQLCWLAGDGELCTPLERTIVDDARDWVDRIAAERPALAAALADGGIARAAARATQLWRSAWLASISDLRRSDAVVSGRLWSHVERTCSGLMRAIVVKHSTFATFLSEPLDGLQRWQSACRLCSWLVCCCTRGVVTCLDKTARAEGGAAPTPHHTTPTPHAPQCG